jgi:hypothetical protein
MRNAIKDLGKAFLFKIILLVCLGSFFWGYKRFYPCARIDVKEIYLTGTSDGHKRS